jgi:hypothetical protein
MDIRKLVGERILVKCDNRYGMSDVTEVRVLEVSPSGQWAKLMNINGLKFWKPVTSISLVEMLTELHGEPKPAEDE